MVLKCILEDTSEIGNLGEKRLKTALLIVVKKKPSKLSALPQINAQVQGSPRNCELGFPDRTVTGMLILTGSNWHVRLGKK